MTSSRVGGRFSQMEWNNLGTFGGIGSFFCEERLFKREADWEFVIGIWGRM
jgi:hypothetical protein